MLFPDDNNTPSTQCEVRAVTSFFQIGTDSFSVSIKNFGGITEVAPPRKVFEGSIDQINEIKIGRARAAADRR